MKHIRRAHNNLINNMDYQTISCDKEFVWSRRMLNVEKCQYYTLDRHTVNILYYKNLANYHKSVPIN